MPDKFLELVRWRDGSLSQETSATTREADIAGSGATDNDVGVVGTAGDAGSAGGTRFRKSGVADNAENDAGQSKAAQTPY